MEVGGMAIDITELKYYQEKTVDQAAKLNAIYRKFSLWF